MIHTPNIEKNRCAHPDLNCKVRGGTEECNADICMQDDAYEELIKLFNNDESAVQRYVQLALNWR